MNWLNAFGVAAAGFLMLYALLRVERRSLWLILLLLVGPGILLIVRWASVRGAWPETLAGFGAAGLATAAWWAVFGRRMAPASSDSIKVWGQERQPRPRPEDMAALQAENMRLRDEAARLEAELRRARGPNPPETPPGPR